MSRKAWSPKDIETLLSRYPDIDAVRRGSEERRSVNAIRKKWKLENEARNKKSKRAAAVQGEISALSCDEGSDFHDPDCQLLIPEGSRSAIFQAHADIPTASSEVHPGSKSVAQLLTQQCDQSSVLMQTSATLTPDVAGLFISPGTDGLDSSINPRFWDFEDATSVGLYMPSNLAMGYNEAAHFLTDPDDLHRYIALQENLTSFSSSTEPFYFSPMISNYVATDPVNEGWDQYSAVGGQGTNGPMNDFILGGRDGSCDFGIYFPPEQYHN